MSNAAEQQEQPDAWSQRPPMQDPYFTGGQYMVAVRKIGTNRAGNPFANLQVTQSHDGKRVNMYATINFHLVHKSYDAAQYWKRRYAQFREAVGLTDAGMNPGDIIDRELCMSVRNSGYVGRIGLTFHPAEDYESTTVHDERNPPPMDEPNMYDDGKIPF